MFGSEVVASTHLQPHQTKLSLSLSLSLELFSTMAPKGTKAQKTAEAPKTAESAEVAEPSSGSGEKKAFFSFNNWAKYCSKQGSDDARQLAEIGKAEYKACSQEEKTMFLEKFLATKDNKNKGWMNIFKETLVKHKSCVKDLVEKYQTRH